MFLLYLRYNFEALINRIEQFRDDRIKTFLINVRAVRHMSRICQTEKIVFKIQIVKISNNLGIKTKKNIMQDEIIVLNQRYQWFLSSKTK